jgi:hypothetical protein
MAWSSPHTAGRWLRQDDRVRGVEAHEVLAHVASDDLLAAGELLHEDFCEAAPLLDLDADGKPRAP